MWTKHVTREGETLEDIAKKYKIKKPEEIWKYPGNAICKKAYKVTKKFPKKMKITVPDPKEKVYVLKHNGKDAVISKKEFEKVKKDAAKMMDRVYQNARIGFENAANRHDAQKEVNDNYPVVSFMTSGAGKGDAQLAALRAVAETQVKNLKTVVTKRDYAKFTAQTADTQAAVNKYRKAVGKWLAELTGSAQTWATSLEFTRDASFVIVGACAMTVAAPAGAAATLAWGGGVSAGTAFVSSSANEVGRLVAGEKVDGKQSAAKVATDTAKGAVFGAVTAGMGRFLSKGVVAKLAPKIAYNGTASKIATRLAGKGRYERFFAKLAESELKAFASATGKEVSKDVLTAAYLQAAPKIFTKLIVRTGVSGLSKYTRTEAEAALKDYLAKNAAKKGGKMSNDKIFDMIANEISDDAMYDKIAEKMFDDSKSVLEKEFRAEIKAILFEESKKL